MIPRLMKTEVKDSLIFPFGTVHYRLIQSSRRRSIEISVSETHGLSVTAPRTMPDATIRQFMMTKTAWIAKRLKEWEYWRDRMATRGYNNGQEFLFLGHKYPLEVRAGEVRLCQIVFDGNHWVAVVPQNLTPSQWAGVIKSKLIQWYRRQAEEVFAGRVFYYARQMKLEPLKIGIRAQKRLWGSCSRHNKSINLNWQLIMTPMEVLDYVVVHELCHLEVPNHSKKFWKAVETVLPDYRSRQRWLKTHRMDMILP